MMGGGNKITFPTSFASMGRPSAQALTRLRPCVSSVKELLRLWFAISSCSACVQPTASSNIAAAWCLGGGRASAGELSVLTMSAKAELSAVESLADLDRVLELIRKWLSSVNHAGFLAAVAALSSSTLSLVVSSSGGLGSDAG